MRRRSTGGTKLFVVAAAVAAVGLGGLYTYQSSHDPELGVEVGTSSGFGSGAVAATAPPPAMLPTVPANATASLDDSIGQLSAPASTQPAIAPAAVAPAGGPPATQPTLGGIQAPVYDVLTEARQLATRGDLVGARTVANKLLLAGTLMEADTAMVKLFMSDLSQKLIFSTQKFPEDPLVATYTIKTGDRLQRVAYDHDISWELLGRINGISDPRRVRVGQALKVIRGPFYAKVDKSDFTMDVYLGGIPGIELPPSAPPMNTATASVAETQPSITTPTRLAEPVYITSFKVGLGANDSTPTGLWRVEFGQKLKNPTYFSPRGEGVIAADDPANPLGEFWIGLSGLQGNAVGKTSYGIHGTIEPDTIGTQSSLGCIRLVNEDIAQVFELLYEVHSMVLVVD